MDIHSVGLTWTNSPRVMQTVCPKQRCAPENRRLWRCRQNTSRSGHAAAIAIRDRSRIGGLPTVSGHCQFKCHPRPVPKHVPQTAAVSQLCKQDEHATNLVRGGSTGFPASTAPEGCHSPASKLDEQTGIWYRCTLLGICSYIYM